MTPFIILSIHLICAGRRVRLLRDFSARSEILTRPGIGFSTPVEGERLFRLHHFHHAGDGSGVSNARSDLRSSPNRACYGRFHGQDLEDRDDRYPDQCRDLVANQRYCKHAAFCGANDGSLRDIHLRRMDFQQASDNDVNASNHTVFSHFSGN